MWKGNIEAEGNYDLYFYLGWESKNNIEKWHEEARFSFFPLIYSGMLYLMLSLGQTK